MSNEKDRLDREVEEIKKGIKKKCPHCGLEYTCSEELHLQFCEGLNPGEDEEGSDE